MSVSKLTKVRIKDIWKTEDKDFTPWLVENIARLNEDIGFNIQDPQKENRLENFIVDIVGEDEEGKVWPGMSIFYCDYGFLTGDVTHWHPDQEDKPKDPVLN